MIFVATNLDSSLIFLIFILSIIGLIRGFLNELASIINWSGSFYLTSKIKPLIVPFLKNKIQIPFILDIIVNAVVFVSLIITLSILNKYLISKIKKIIPTSTNNGLGFLFGFIKGILLSGLIVAFLTIIYKNSIRQPDWLYNSYFYNSNKSRNCIFINIINVILGDLIDNNKNNNQIINNIEDESDEVKKDIIEDLKSNVQKKEDIEKLIDLISN